MIDLTTAPLKEDAGKVLDSIKTEMEVLRTRYQYLTCLHEKLVQVLSENERLKVKITHLEKENQHLKRT